MDWGHKRLPWGMRSLIGISLTILGVFGFLPIIGFWMLPLGLAFIALDIPPCRKRLRQWMDAHSEQKDPEKNLE